MKVCIIPARGGSKRIPQKNLRNFCGLPMITWSLRAALESGCFDQVIVSTDDEEIADHALQEGALVPFLRSSELADDYTPTVPVIVDAIRHLQLKGNCKVCCLYATAPFVRPCDLRESLVRLNQPNVFFVVSVTSYAFPIQRALRRGETGMIEMLDPVQMNTRSQDLEETWHDAGQFYWGTAESWGTRKGVFEENTHGFELPRHRVQDIDTMEDWQRAEAMMRVLQLEEPQ